MKIVCRSVLDLNLITWLSKAEVNYPSLFDDFAHPNGTFNGKDISMYLMRTNQKTLGHCLEDIITVGFIDTNSIGCVASQVVLYVSLVFIIGVVGIRFFMAVMFAWFFSWRIGNFKSTVNHHFCFQQVTMSLRTYCYNRGRHCARLERDG